MELQQRGSIPCRRKIVLQLADLTAYTGRRERNMKKDETRCHSCQERKTCPAFDTGVMYPCPYYKEDINNGAEE